MRLAVLFNKNNDGPDRILHAVAENLSLAFRRHEIISHSLFGAGFFKNQTLVVDADSSYYGDDYKRKVKDAVISLYHAGADRFITVGGDGLAAYVADALITHCEQSGKPVPPLAGVAAGTANVGPIVSIPADKISSLDIENSYIVPTGGVAVYDGDKRLGFAFNDAVIGNTFLGTLGKDVVNLSVEAMAVYGRQEAMRPGEIIATEAFSITSDGSVLCRVEEFPVDTIKQIIVSPLQFDRLYGRAIMGQLIKGAYRPDVAALVISDRILVAFGDDANQSRCSTVRQLVFDAYERIELHGLGPHAHIIIDGNPYVRQTDQVAFSYLPKVIPVWRANGVGLDHESR
ncbi:MAG: diacylglycerol kinase family protein [Sphaerochaetaceae bacterium]|jgi:hypothetical protein|nr:diacylglycerol kinase family protein [Sphaerochaetaceae bacterium]NLV84874.1 hypothetical protein [Spirochaetales bacterium]